MKKRFFIGLMLMLFAFIVTPFQTKASAVDVDVGIEQSDMDITLTDAVQPEMYTAETSSQVATPLIYPTLACEYNYYANDLFQVNSCLMADLPELYIISSRQFNTNNSTGMNVTQINMNKEGLFRLDIGENLNHSKLACNRE